MTLSRSGKCVHSPQFPIDEIKVINAIYQLEAKGAAETRTRMAPGHALGSRSDLFPSLLCHPDSPLITVFQAPYVGTENLLHSSFQLFL